MPADLGRLQELLNRLEEHWQRVNAPVVALARSGLEPEQIEELSARIGLRLPAEVRCWFSWHDGAEPSMSGQATMGPRFYLPSLAHRVSAYVDERQSAAEAHAEGWAESDDELWAKSWFPVFESAVGRSPAIVDVNVSDGELAPIGHVAKESVDPPGKGRSLTTLVEFWVSCHDSGLYEWQPDKNVWRADINAIQVTSGPYSPFYM